MDCRMQTPARAVVLGDQGEADLLRRLLDRLGMTARIAVTPTLEGFIRLLPTAPFDFVLVGMGREGLDLGDVIRAWRTKAPETPLVLLTVPGWEEVAAMGAREGALVVPRSLLARIVAHRSAMPAIQDANTGEGSSELGGERDEWARRLASRVSHGVKNPLTLIVMGIEYLRRHLRDPDPEVLDTLRDMESAVGDANAVVRMFTEVMSTGSVDTRPESVNEMVADVLQRMSLQFERRGIVVATDLAPSLSPVRIDRSRTIGVLEAILRNAHERLPQGGAVQIRTSSLRSAAGEVIDESIVVVEVTDSGDPLSREDLETMLDPLGPGESGEEAASSRLPLVREIIELQGGSIVAQHGEESKGLRLTIALRGDRSGRLPSSLRSAPGP